MDALPLRSQPERLTQIMPSRRVPRFPYKDSGTRGATVRTFTCFTFDNRCSVPTLSFVFAADEMRARLLARRELLDTPDAVSLELYEGSNLLWMETASPSGEILTVGPPS